MRIAVDKGELERNLPDARRRLTASGLPQLLAEIDPGAFGTTPLNLEACAALADAVAVALGASAADGIKPAALGFLLAEEASDRLAALGDCLEPPDTAGLPSTQYRDLPSAAPDDLLRVVLKDCAGFVRFYKDHPETGKRLTRDLDALRCLHSYFRLLPRILRKIEPGGLDLQAETPRLRVDGWRASPKGTDGPVELMPATFDDIVGNDEYVKAGKRLARDVAGFDPKAGENPKKVRNQVLFVLGAPGSGKTVTAHAIGRYFLDLCESADLPAAMRVIRRTDWASAYQNQSASRLLEIFKEEVFNAPGVCGAYWPDIDTAFAARSDADIRQEEKANLGTLFGILDGTIGPRNGKWFLICDANTLNMDEATLSRLSQTPVRAPGPVTPEDFVKLLRDVKLRGKSRWLPLSEAQWRAVGARCVQEKLSGRSIDSISGRILTAIEDFDEPDDYFSMGFEAKRALIERLSKAVDAGRVQAIIDAHCRFEREAQDRAEAERFRNRVQEIRFHLSAQRAALAPFGQGDGPQRP